MGDLDGLNTTAVRQLGVTFLERGIRNAYDGNGPVGETADYAALATALFARANDMEMAEVGDTIDYLAEKTNPEHITERQARLERQKVDDKPRRVDLYGMHVCECTGAATAAPIIGGVCLRRWIAETLPVIGAHEMSVEGAINELMRRAEAYETMLSDHRRVVEEDRFVVLLTCSHWTQTRRPNDEDWYCERCQKTRTAAKFSSGDPAVLQGWSPAVLPLAELPSPVVAPAGAAPFDPRVVWVIRVTEDDDDRFMRGIADSEEAAWRAVDRLNIAREDCTVVPWEVVR